MKHLKTFESIFDILNWEFLIKLVFVCLLNHASIKKISNSFMVSHARHCICARGHLDILSMNE